MGYWGPINPIGPISPIRPMLSKPWDLRNIPKKSQFYFRIVNIAAFYL